MTHLRHRHRPTGDGHVDPLDRRRHPSARAKLITDITPNDALLPARFAHADD